MSRSWISLSKEVPAKTFNILTYNVLSDVLAKKHNHLYHKANSQLLKWTNRFPRLIGDIKSHDSDIISLQEVEQDQAEDFIKALPGYTSRYIKRTGGIKSDGSLLLVSTAKWKIETTRYIEFNTHNLNDNIAIIVVLSLIGSKDKVCIGSTHLLWNPKNHSVRLKQLTTLAETINEIVGEDVPIVIAGDFNTAPHDKVYSF